MGSLVASDNTTIKPAHLSLLKLVLEEHCAENGIDIQPKAADEIAKWLIRSYRRGSCKESKLRWAINARYGAHL